MELQTSTPASAAPAHRQAGMSNQELQDQFRRCEQWNDPEQWELLALEYHRQGYDLNAAHCFQQADKCRELVTA